jgi:hypothetical protein
MNTYELIGINLIFLVSSILALLFLAKTPDMGPEERKLERMLLIGFLLFQSLRWIPFLLSLLLGSR